MPNIVLKDNDRVVVTPKYGNLSRSISKKDPTTFYYTLECEEGRINASNVLATAIAENWCGRGGSFSIEKLNATRFSVEIVSPPEKVFALELKGWSDEAGGYEDLPLSLPLPHSVGHQLRQEAIKNVVERADEGVPLPDEQDAPPQQAQVANTAPSSVDGWKLIGERLEACIGLVDGAIENAGYREIFSSEEIQKFVVMAYMSAEKKNLLPDSMDENLPLKKVVETFDGEVTEEDLPF